MARLVYERGGSRKFWEGVVDGSKLTVRFGRLGTAGQARTKKLASAAAAKAELAALVAEKEKKGYVPETKSEGLPGMTRARRTALLALARELGGTELAHEVALAVDDPERYLRDFKKRMDAIGVDEPRPDLGWLALTEGLDAAKVAVEFDWREEVDSIYRQLRRHVSAGAKAALARVGPEIECSAEEALERYGRALAGVDRALVQLDKQSDSYKVTIVAPKMVPVLRSLAKKAGGAVRWFRGEPKVLAALAKERQQKRARSKREEALAESDNPWTRLVHSTWQRNADGALWRLRQRPFPVEEIRAAMPHAPKRDQPLIAMALALHDQRASGLARTTSNPELCLRALKYLGQEHRYATERLVAAAVLAERLGIPPKRGPRALHVVEACNLFGDDEKNERSLWRVPAKQRRRLAEIAERLLLETDVWDTQHRALNALRAVGDERSVAVLEACRGKISATDMVDAYVRHIRKRVAT